MKLRAIAIPTLLLALAGTGCARVSPDALKPRQIAIERRTSAPLQVEGKAADMSDAA